MIFEDIDWNDGMLVCSSHLKNIKQVNFYNLFFLIGKKLKFFYGVISMELDTQQVLNGIIKINNTLCVMPDGSVIDFNVYNTSNQTLYIDLKNKNINNEQEQIICLSAFINNCVDQNARLYNINNVKYENQNTSVLTEYINFNKIKPYINLDSECTANMTFIPILKVKKVNNNYFLQDFLYLHFIVTKDTKFGKQILLFVSELLAKIYLTHNKIKLLHSEKYIDYEIFNLIRAYDNISYILYSIQQQINEQGINMYCLYLKLCDLLRKAQALTLQNIQESPEFNIHNLYELFTTLINNIEKLTNSVFYCDINVVTMNKNNNGEFRTEYSNNAIINNKIYIQCVYSSQFLQQNNINSIIKNMSICSSSCVNYVNSTRVTGLERKIKNNIVEIKDIIGVVNLENAVVIEVYLSDNKFFKYNEELVIILPKDTVNKFSFNIIYPNTHKKT